MNPEPVNCEECPFDSRLPRTPYLVIPKLALQAMPLSWRLRLEALLVEADEAGLETPDYIVLRDGKPYAWRVHEDDEDPTSSLDRVEVYRSDPWAGYRHASDEDVVALCPTFKRPRPDSASVDDVGSRADTKAGSGIAPKGDPA